MSAGSTFLATLIVARLIDPTDFGLAAIALAVSAVAQVLCFAGIPQALIRTQHVDTTLSDQVLWILVGLGVIGSAICWAVAAPMAAAYDAPVLFWLIGVGGMECIIAAFVQFPTALLTRKMRTRSLAVRMLGYKAVSVLVTVSVAAFGGGAWSLVLGALAGSVASVVLLWRTQPRRPRFQRLDRRLFPILGMGSLIMLEQALTVLSIRGFVLLFGKYHGLHDLGLVNFAMRLVDEVGALVTMTVQRVSLAGFVAMKRAGQDLEKVYLLGAHGIMLLVSPLFLGIAAIAPDAVPLIFGERWLEAVIVVQVLAFFWALRLNRVLSPALMRTVGAQGPLVLIAAAGLLFTITATVLTQDSVLFLAASAYGARVLATYPLGLITLKRAAGVPILKQIGTVVFPLLAGGVMALVVIYGREFLIEEAPALPAVLRMLLLIVLGAIVYSGLVMTFDATKVRRFVQLVKSR